MAFSLGIMFALLSMFGFGISNVLLKKLTPKLDIITLAVSRSIFVTMFLFLTAFAFTDFFVPDTKTILMIAGIGLLGTVAYVALIKAVSLGKVSIIMPITSSYLVITVALSIIFFHESLSLLQIIAIIIIFDEIRGHPL